MTLEEARASIGRAVAYDSGHGPREHGIITSVVIPDFGPGGYVHVRYGVDPGSKATRPEDLTLLVSP